MKSSLRRLNLAAWMRVPGRPGEGLRLPPPLLLLAVAVVGLMLLARLTGSFPFGDSDVSRGGGAGETKPTRPKPSPPGQPSGQALDGKRLLLASVDQLTQGPSISARLHQRIKLQDGDVLGVGSYQQEAPRDGGRFNLQLRTKAGALQVVSDGNHIWHHAAIGSTRRITRIDLQYERLASSHASAASATRPPGSLFGRRISPLEFGGIGQLIGELVERYRFERIQRKVLSDVPIYEIRGVLERAGGSTASAPPSTGGPVSPASDTALAPPQVPSHVTVSLGRDDLFPYRIVFDARNADAADYERGVPRRIEIQFSEVSLDGPIDNRSFEYSPPRDVAWEDVTAEAVARRDSAS